MNKHTSLFCKDKEKKFHYIDSRSTACSAFSGSQSSLPAWRSEGLKNEKKSLKKYFVFLKVHLHGRPLASKTPVIATAAAPTLATLG